jgi:Rrf2 family transcriptional regulator, iron-sulfur cluster assembly transcription factor
MIFSKTFGYSIRGILYVASINECKSRIPIDEIAEQLGVPRHFLSKVMKRLVKAGILDSKKGPAGGFCLNPMTLQTRLIRLVEITGETGQFNSCVISLRQCSSRNPCPLHYKAEGIKKQWLDLFTTTKIGDLLEKKPDFITSLMSN